MFLCGSNMIRRYGFCFTKNFICNYSKDIISISNYRSRWDEKLKSLLKRYEDIFGITRLTEMHEKVLEVQGRMQSVQEKRRKVQDEMFLVQAKLQEIQAKLEKTPRGDDMFISIVTQEHELLKEQKRQQHLLSLYDQTEREEQTALALAINNSQDHEKTYREKNKYISLITGVVGGLIGLIGSSVNNWRHKKDIKLFANDISTIIKDHNVELGSKMLYPDFKDALSDLSRSLEKLNYAFSSDESLIEVYKNVEQQTQNLLSIVRTQDAVLSDVVQNIRSFLAGPSEVCSENVHDFYSDLFVKKILEQVEERLEHKLHSQRSINVLFGSLLLLAGFVIYASSSH